MELIIILILLTVGFYYLLKLSINRQSKKVKLPKELFSSSQYNKATRSSGELEALKKRLRCLLYGDSNAQTRIIEAERRRSPNKSEAELYQDAIDRLERDRKGGY